MKLSLRNTKLFVYITKCVSGVLLCFLVSLVVGRWVDYPWSLISVVLVLSPEGKDALELAHTRIKANLVGASCGLLVLLTRTPGPWNIVAAAALALWACDRLGLNNGARSTLAAVIIVLLHGEWGAALSRVLAVFVGCLLGLGVTALFHALIRIDATAVNSEAVEEGGES